MKMLKLLLLVLMIPTLLVSCKSEEDSGTVVYRDYVPVYRWMDRQIYFAFSSGNSPERNNEFQKASVQDALRDIELNSNLGENYFTFTEVDEAVLQPVYEAGQSETEYRSFILIWPDADFNDFVVNTLGGMVPDSNAVTVINSAYKKKFYIIIKSSCFTSGNTCNAITGTGLRGLVARQLGSLVGMPMIQDCSADPGNTMCASIPTNDQWNDFNKLRFLNSFNNSLETILNNPTYYIPYTPAN